MSGARTGRRLPEHVATTIRRVEPVGDAMVRLYFAVERGAAWDDQCTILMPTSCLPDALLFAVSSTKAISQEIAAPETTAH